MHILIATDSFKGCLSSQSAGEAIARGVRRVGHSAFVMPIADGGEGTIEALKAIQGAEIMRATVSDPLMRQREASYLRLPDSRIIIESASAIGLTLVEPSLRNPLSTSSFGIGTLINHAIRQGAKLIDVALGGTATNDAGMGALQALGARLFDSAGYEIATPATGADLISIKTIDFAPLPRGVKLNLLCDAAIPFTGPTGAVALYSAQKGADAGAMSLLEEGMHNIKEILESHSGIILDSSGGAAGGLEAGLMCAFGASRSRGIQVVLDVLNFRDFARNADLVITGEGKADCQTLQGKAAKGVLDSSGTTRVVLLAGKVDNLQSLLEAGFTGVININSDCDSSIDPMDSEVAENRLADAAEKAVQLFCRNFS